jgi:hypothetical protein
MITDMAVTTATSGGESAGSGPWVGELPNGGNVEEDQVGDDISESRLGEDEMEVMGSSVEEERRGDLDEGPTVDEENNSQKIDTVESTPTTSTIEGSSGRSDVEWKKTLGGSAVAIVATGSGVVVHSKKKKISTRNSDQNVPQQSSGVETGQGSTTISIAGTAPTTMTTSTTTVELPLMTAKYIAARAQPKSVAEESALAAKYASIPDVGDRAYQILVDLGMIECA